MTRAPDFRERAGFQSNAQTGGARSTGNLRARETRGGEWEARNGYITGSASASLRKYG